MDIARKRMQRRESYRRNREESIARVKAWKAANPDKVKESRRRYYEKHKAEINAKVAAWQKANPEKAQAAQRRNDAKRPFRRSKMTLEQYEQRLAKQGGRCAVCGDSNPHTRNGRFRDDHCHETGEHRGLLCNSCNIAIGLFKEDPNLLYTAAEYVRSRGRTLRLAG